MKNGKTKSTHEIVNLGLLPKDIRDIKKQTKPGQTVEDLIEERINKFTKTKAYVLREIFRNDDCQTSVLIDSDNRLFLNREVPGTHEEITLQQSVSFYRSTMEYAVDHSCGEHFDFWLGMIEGAVDGVKMAYVEFDIPNGLATKVRAAAKEMGVSENAIVTKALKAAKFPKQKAA